jgi:sugar lactone lactonase YvrE
MKLFLQRVRKAGAIKAHCALLVLMIAASFSFASRASGQATFKIDSLTANNVSAVDAASQMEDDRAGIAVSSSKAFLVGDCGPNCGSGADAGIWNRIDFSSPSHVGAHRDGLAMEIHSQNVYTFADGVGNPVPANSLAPSTITISELVLLDPNTGALTSTVINLSAPITITYGTCCDPHGQAGVFAGYDRIVVVDSTNATGTAYNIDLPSGTVTTLGTITDSNYAGRSSAEGWATYGVAEFFGGDLYIDYVDGISFPHTKILRTKVSTNVTSTLVDFSPQDISDGHEFTAVPTLNRWYFHYEGCSGNSIAGPSNCDETLGFADATYTISQQCTAPPGGMVSWWPAEGNGDDIISHNNLSLGPAGFSSGKVGQAFSFGANGFASAGTPSSLTNLGNQVTIDGWVNPSNTTQGVYFGRSQAFGNDYALFCLGGPTCVLQSYLKVGGTEYVLSDGQPVPAGTWTHVAMAYDGTTVALYRNGVAVSSTSVSGNVDNDGAAFTVGGRSGDLFFSGLIDEVEVFNRGLSASEVQAIYLADSAGKCHSCTPPPPNLVGWWPGDGNTKDLASGNTGQLKNGATFAPGEVSQAFSFNGNNQYVLIGDPVPAELQIQNEITLDAWIYVTGYPTAGDALALIVGSQHDATLAGATIFLDGRTNPDGQTAPPGHIHFQIGDGSFHATNANARVPLNQWVHIAATRKANEDGKIYYNGVLQPSTSVAWSGSISYNGAWFAIGQQKDLDRPFNGLIDEVEVFNRALTPDEIQFIFDAGSFGKCKPTCITPPSGLIDWWPADNTATDIQGMHNGTLKNGAAFASGKVDRAFSLNGNYVDVGSIDLGTTFTIDAWINPVTVGSNPVIISNVDNSEIGYFLLVGSDGSLQNYVNGDTGTTDYRSVPAVTTGKWQHVVMTYDGGAGNGGKVKFYVDGAAVAIANVYNDGGGNTGHSTFPATIGVFQNNSNFFTGRIDELEIFNRPLTPDEVSALYSASSAGKCKTVRFYVSNASNSTVEKFDSNGHDLGAFADSTSLNAPLGLVFDPSGNLYVSNYGDRTIVRFDPTGVVHPFVSPGVSAYYALAFDGNLNLYASLYGAHNIEKFDSNGNDLGPFASNLNGPLGLAFDTSGNLFVATFNDSTIREFGPSGNDLGTFANSGLANPYGIAFDASGQLYATNSNANSVTRFDSNANPTTFANTGLSYPIGLAFDEPGNLYVVNDSNLTIEKFDPSGHGTPFANSGLAGPWYIAVQLLSPTAACIQFDKPSYSVNETDGSVTLTVTRNGDVSGTATVYYATTPGSAGDPGDYTGTSGTLNFNSGDSSMTIPVTINEQTDPSSEQNEGNKTFTVTLSNVTGTGQMLSGPATATVTIIDDDSDSEPPTKTTPSISTQASAATTVGGSISDAATVSATNQTNASKTHGKSSARSTSSRKTPVSGPTGTVTFKLYGNSSCTGAPVFTSTVPLDSNGNATSDTYTPTSPGTYYFLATYNGDDHFNSVSTPCGDANESVVVTKANPSVSTQASSNVDLGGTISDAATLTGGASPTGTVTFKVYGPNNSSCSGSPAFTSTNTVNANEQASSDTFTPTAPGTYRFLAVYNGDDNNNGVTGTCGGETESVVVNKATPSINTQASNGVSLGGTISDTAAVTGGSSPTGTVTFNVFGPNNSSCSGSPAFTSTNALDANGHASSNNFTPTAQGTYRFVAVYIGDTNNNSVSGVCGTEGESVVVSKPTPSISTQASNNVVIGGSISDTATLTGGSHPTGTVTFNVYGPNDSSCSSTAAFTSTNSVDANGHASSNNFTPTAQGTYRFTATYNGDSNNNSVSTNCGDEGESVVVSKASPSIRTTASGTITLGGSISDTATLTNGSHPSGNVTFTLFSPNNSTCSGTPAFTSTVSVNAGGSATSGSFTPSTAGTYRFIASYAGNSNNNAIAGHCGDSGESVVVNPKPTPTPTPTPRPTVTPTPTPTGTPGNKPEANVFVSPAQVSAGQDAIFKISAAPPHGQVTITFSMSGSAKQGTDYTLNNNTGKVTLGAGQYSTNVTLHALTNRARTGNVTATMTLNPGTTYQLSHKSDTVTILK